MIRKLAFLVAAAVFTGCEQRMEKEPIEENATAASNISLSTEQLNIVIFESATTGVKYELWDQVPNNEVCMVNDAYMGRLQMEVPHQGRMYYGCCEMCVERIPNDPEVRVAKDPHTSEEVDKAEAYIVLAGPQGQVMFFANEENYREFLKAGKNS